MSPIEFLLSLGSTLIERLFPDPAAAAQAKLELFKLQQSGELAAMTAQTDINKVEAGNTSVFVSGWRPFVGWVAGLACAWNWIGLPVALFLCNFFGHPINLTPADTTTMMPVLMGMLGLGGLRTVEKIHGVDAK